MKASRFTATFNHVASAVLAGFIGVAFFTSVGCNVPRSETADVELTPAAIENAVGSDVQPTDLVLVKFGATWCGPCRELDKELASLKPNLPDGVRVVSIDVDERPDASRAFGIESIPRIFVVRGGEVLADQVGYQSEADLQDWIGGF